MLFNSLVFAIFLGAVVGLFWVLPRNWRTGLLLAASYVFYGWWDYRFLGLILVSTGVDFWAGGRIARQPDPNLRRRYLSVSLLVNLGILGFFKYWGFFVDSAASLLESLGADSGLPTLRLLLPVGISFYTFQTLSYTIDVYRGEMDPEPSLVRFALFVAFFPQLVAGPIERARRLLPQLRSWPEDIRNVEWRTALTLIARGLFRKVVIADGLAPIVNDIFATPRFYGTISIFVGVMAFSLQIYGDFAGYTDIARGTAKLFGVDLMINFRAPYRSRTFSEFWRRWHISLSTWLRDYLYIPLGGNRRGPVRTYINLLVTMLLGGLWHGAGWGFVIWGGLHGVYLATERLLQSRAGRRVSLPAPVLFLIVSLTWIPFRAPSFGAGISVMAALANFRGANIELGVLVVGLMGLLTLVIDDADLKGRINPVSVLPPFVRGLSYGLAAAAIPLFSATSAIPFIYFQF